MLSLVIPVYKNEASLNLLLEELDAVADRVSGGLEVVFVVDGSPDQSLERLRAQLPSWRVPTQLIELSRNFGSFSAIAAGLRHGRGDYFAVLAADLQEPPELALKFHEAMSTRGADVVFGHRSNRSDPWGSRLFSIAFWSFYRRFVVPDVPRGGIDVFGCTRTVRDRLLELKEVNTSLVALLLWLGFRREYVSYERQPRQHGRSAWTFGRKVRYALDSVFGFTDLPIKILLLLGSTATAFAVIAAVTVFVAWAMGLVPVLGYAPLMLAITSFGGLTALGLGIVGQYLWLALQNARNRPSFIVRSVEHFSRPGSDG
jgi:glycosyltransferase involved in cell wall biosynthesis